MHFLPLLALASLAASPLPHADRAQWLMGTICEIRAYGAHADTAISAAFEEIARWDQVLSLYRQDSELVLLNSEAAVRPHSASPSLWGAVTAGMIFAEMTSGAFDPTILPILRRGEASLPSVGYLKVDLDHAKRTISFKAKDMGLDFGALGKGLALDRAASILKEKGINSALINFGGQIFALGAPPGEPGWRVTVPGRKDQLVLRDASVSTSGNSERSGHIVSPFTGKRLLRKTSVSVIAETGAEADAWSTALFVLGRPSPRFRSCALFDGQLDLPACRRFVVKTSGGGNL